MNSKNRTLNKAVNLLIKGQLTRCIQLLEPKISLFLDNADYFYLLGRCYFTAGDSENAKLYLKRGLENNPNHEEILLLQACFAVKERNTYRAISIWLKLENTGCRLFCLRYGLDQIRRINDVEELYNFTRGPKFAKLFPALPGIYRYRILCSLKRLFLIASLFTAVWFLYRSGVPKLEEWYTEWRQQREESAIISLAGLESADYLAFEKEETLFTLDIEELDELVKTIRKNYDSYNDNLVQRDINKIFYSNASNKVKEKFHIIESMLAKRQEIYNLKNNFDFSKVRQNPQLYQNCFVRWEGKPTNIRINDDGKLEFSLLVGYTDGRVLEGQVSVQVADLVSVSVDQPIIVFGRIQIIDLVAEQRKEITAKAAGKKNNSFRQEQKADSKEDHEKKTPATFYIEAKTLAYS